MSFSRVFTYTGIDKLSPMLDKIGKKTDKMSKKMVNVGKKMQGMGRAMATRVTLPIVAGLGTIIYQGAKFEDSMASLEAITGLTGKTLKNLGKDIMKEGEFFGIGSADFANGMELIGSKQPVLLKTPKLLLEVAKSAAVLSKAAGQDFPVASENLLSIMNAFNIEGKESNKVINILAASAKLGSVLIPYVSEALKRVAGTAKNFKIDIAESTAVVQILGKAMGRTADVTGTSFRAALMEMNEKLGRSSPRLIGLNKALIKIDKQMKRGVDITKIYGRDAVEAILAMVENREKIQSFRKAIQGTNIAYEQAAIKMRTVNQRMARLWVMIKNKLIKAFDLLKPTLIWLIGKTVKFFTILGRLMKNNPITAKVIFALAVALALLPPLLSTIGILAVGIGLAFTPIGFTIMGIIAVVSALTVAIVLAKKHWKELKEMYSPTGAAEGAMELIGLGKKFPLPALGSEAQTAKGRAAIKEYQKSQLEISFKPEGVENYRTKLSGSAPIDLKVVGGWLGL